MNKLIGINDVLALTSLSKSGLYDRMANGGFPDSIKVGLRRVAWIESEVQEWISEQIHQSKKINTHKDLRSNL